MFLPIHIHAMQWIVHVHCIHVSVSKHRSLKFAFVVHSHGLVLILYTCTCSSYTLYILGTRLHIALCFFYTSSMLIYNVQCTMYCT